MSYEEKPRPPARFHSLKLEGREKLEVCGVDDVSGFDESLVLLTTDLGELCIRGQQLHIERIDAPLESILEKYTGEERVKLIHCGGDDMIAAAREQWNDGSNTLCVAPGRVIVYERNDVTNPILRDNGVEILEMPSAELSRGRGGPRCMSMPLIRADA